MNETHGNAFNKCICGKEGHATVIGTVENENTTYRNAKIYLFVNPDLIDHITPVFVIQVWQSDPPNSHNILSIGITHDCGRNIIKEGDRSIRFVNVYQIPPYGDQKTTFTFEFTSDQHYWENDYIGNKFDGFLPPIYGSTDGVIVSGNTSEDNRAAFLDHLQPVFQKMEHDCE